MRGIDRCSSTDDDLPIKKWALSLLVRYDRRHGVVARASPAIADGDRSIGFGSMCVCVIDTYIFASVRARARVLD